MTIKVAINRLPHGKGIPLPAYATSLSAGMDLMAAILSPQLLAPQNWALFPTGIQISLPAGYEAQVRPRSGLALKNGVTVLNAPGTIDADYQGEIKIVLINLSAIPFTVEPGMRIAQLVIAPVIQAHWQEQDILCQQDTDRGEGGFGSTGLF